MQNQVTEIQADLATITDLKRSLEFTQEEVTDLKTKVTTTENKVLKQDDRIDMLVHRLDMQERDGALQKEKQLQLEAYNRRENLNFTGICEDNNETHSKTRNKIYDFFLNTLKITDAKEIKFQRCHRLGITSDHVKKPRDIIVRFVYFPEREMIWSKRFMLEGTNMIMKEDFPYEIEARRTKLYPIYKAAKGNKCKAKLVVDKLYIEGEKYTIENLEDLPGKLQPKSLAVRETEKVVMFYGGNSCLGNFYKADLKVDGKLFNCVEQFVQYQKAVSVGNNEIATKIMSSSDPKKQHQLAKQLKPTSHDQWNNEKAKRVMETGIRAKFV